MRTMYDAVTAANIPPDAKMVAGYCDTIRIPQWTDADWARFPGAVKVRIAKKATTDDGHVLDVEVGDATPGEAPGWVAMRRRAGADPTVYMNASTWPLVQAAFRNQGIPEPHYWVARYDNDPTIPAGAVAKQYRETPGYDLSSVADYWSGVDSGPSPTPVSPSGVEIMEPILVKASPGTTSVRIRSLTGSATTGLIIRPGAGVVWLGNVYAWGDNRNGVGQNPKNIPGYDYSIESDRKIPLAGALWCDVEYSSASDFYIQPVG